MTAKKTTKQATRKTAKKEKLSMLDYLRFGESYTSLVLGIIVVVIATILLLSFIHSKNVNNTPGTTTVATISEATVQTKDEKDNATESGKAKTDPTATPKPTATPTAQPSPTQTAPTTVPTKPRESKDEQKKDNKGKSRTYIVKAGDSLWTIAEEEYKDGYKWVDIARANKLNNPGLVYKGDKLVIPQVDQKNTTDKEVAEKQKTEKASVSSSSGATKITGNKYTIVPGDTLWSIAERAYGDGYQWVVIAKANKLTDNPGLIHSKNTLTIPRK